MADTEHGSRRKWLLVAGAGALCIAVSWLGYPILYETLVLPADYRPQAIETRYPDHLEALRTVASSDDPMAGATSFPPARQNWDRPGIALARIWYSDGTAGFVKDPVAAPESVRFAPRNLLDRLYDWRTGAGGGTLRVVTLLPDGTVHPMVLHAEVWDRGACGFILLFDPAAAAAAELTDPTP